MRHAILFRMPEIDVPDGPLDVKQGSNGIKNTTFMRDTGMSMELGKNRLVPDRSGDLIEESRRYKREKCRRLFFGAGFALCLLKCLQAFLILSVFATKFSIFFSSSWHPNFSLVLPWCDRQ